MDGFKFYDIIFQITNDKTKVQRIIQINYNINI